MVVMEKMAEEENGTKRSREDEEGESKVKDA